MTEQKWQFFFHEKNKNILKSNPIRAGEVARQLRAITAPAKGPGSTPQHTAQLTITCNPRSSGNNALLQTPGTPPHMQAKHNTYE